MPEPQTTQPPAVGDSTAALLAVVDAYLEELRRGQAPDRAAVLAAHPELAARLESCLAALDFIHRAERPDPTLPPALGDFRILREIGRGAMAVGCENGVHFFAMQLIAGRSLSAELAGAKAAGRPLDAKVVAAWGVQAAEA